MEKNQKTIYICITEPLCCIPKTDTILQINYTSIKKRSVFIDNSSEFVIYLFIEVWFYIKFY